MAKRTSNSRDASWAAHDAMLDGRLQEVLDALVRLPGLVERNERRLQMWAAKPSVMDALRPTAKPLEAPDPQASTSVGKPFAVT